MAYPRSFWGARAPKQIVTDHNKTEVFVHHSDGFGMAIDTIAEQCAAMRGIQRFHMDTNGWNDIGYGYVLFQPQGRLKRPRLYVARGPEVLPAAQLNHNAGTIPICVVGNFDHEGVKRATRVRLRRAVKNLVKSHGITKIRGHRDINSTDCPGDHLYPEVARIRSALHLG